MANGLSITEKEFMSLSAKKRDCILFQNQVKTLEAIKGYKFYYKVTTIIGTLLVAGVGILFKMQMGAS